MKVITCNLNGIRSATQKGFWQWFEQQNADFLCLQELRAHLGQIPKEALIAGYYRYFNLADRKGYSGVAVYSREKPLKIVDSLALAQMDLEGRYLELEFENCVVASLYLPSGTSGEHRQDFKYTCMDAVIAHF
jgi:exodeoxyribonuclease-3